MEILYFWFASSVQPAFTDGVKEQISGAKTAVKNEIVASLPGAVSNGGKGNWGRKFKI